MNAVQAQVGVRIFQIDRRVLQEYRMWCDGFNYNLFFFTFIWYFLVLEKTKFSLTHCLPNENVFRWEWKIKIKNSNQHHSPSRLRRLTTFEFSNCKTARDLRWEQLHRLVAEKSFPSLLLFLLQWGCTQFHSKIVNHKAIVHIRHTRCCCRHRSTATTTTIVKDQ